MEPDWKEIARNISGYADNDTFLSARSPQQIAKILSYAKLSPCEFATLFTNLSNYHGKADILMMLSRTRLKDFNSQEEASEISDTISSILGIQILDSLFSFYQNKLQEITETKNHKSQSPVPEYANIDVLLSSGKRWTFENIDLNIRVEDFRSLILKKFDKSTEYIEIFYHGQRLNNGHTLKEYNIQNYSYVTYIITDLPFSVNVIHIRGPDAIVTTLENIDLNCRVEDLKDMIQDEIDLSTDQQKLSFFGKDMEDGNTLKDYNVLYGDTISLTWTKFQIVSPTIPANSITLKTLAGRVIILKSIDLNCMVVDLKELIHEKIVFPPDQQRLIFDGKQLEDDKTLIDYGVKYGNQIHLLRRCRGGKPVIYLYPKEEIDAKVSIKINDGNFSFVYPSFDEDNTWNVKALPSGEIVHRGKKMRYLFWETLFYPNLNMDKGFIIKGEDSVSFFEDKLKSMNLNDAEICDFITYWCPKLCGYKYVKVCFQFENFDDMCPMNVEPKPDNINRVFFAALPLESPCDIEPQELPTFNRDGFTVIEWGGTIVTSEKL